MKNYLFYVGIDVSKLKLDVVVLNSKSINQTDHFIVENNQKGIKSIVTYLQKKKINLITTLFCYESTGVYNYPLNVFLSEKKIDYWVVPPLEIKRAKGLVRGKNDKTDAKDIAYYSLRNIDKLNLSSVPEKEIQQLKLLFSEREKLVKAILLFESSKENRGFMSKDVYKEIALINSKTIQNLKNSLKGIEKKMKAIIINTEQLKQQYDLVKSIPGVGEQTAIYFIIATKGFKAFKTWRKFACYSGVAPFEYSSGTSVRGKTKVNHLADKKMKSLLQMCAMTSIKYDPQLKEYYTKKKAEGKNGMLVLNNIRCKIISRVFAVINRQTPYINTYKFAG
ncbi:IS110 family transposase [Flavobacterium frigoris]|uniref:Transposase n=1 Tax=Flavobacterium frigoris (strain PS1) TaxID=1086011 RepID=H7FWK8_FLAFP|nr:IS110 family transposase [Flavobacterium frigoris]EIA07112.1 transposase [Flavobacterium frigoris PS1]